MQKTKKEIKAIGRGEIEKFHSLIERIVKENKKNIFLRNTKAFKADCAELARYFKKLSLEYQEEILNALIDKMAESYSYHFSSFNDLLFELLKSSKIETQKLFDIYFRLYPYPTDYEKQVFGLGFIINILANRRGIPLDLAEENGHSLIEHINRKTSSNTNELSLSQYDIANIARKTWMRKNAENPNSSPLGYIPQFELYMTDQEHRITRIKKMLALNLPGPVIDLVIDYLREAGYTYFSTPQSAIAYIAEYEVFLNLLEKRPDKSPPVCAEEIRWLKKISLELSEISENSLKITPQVTEKLKNLVVLREIFFSFNYVVYQDYSSPNLNKSRQDFGAYLKNSLLTLQRNLYERLLQDKISLKSCLKEIACFVQETQKYEKKKFRINFGERLWQLRSRQIVEYTMYSLLDLSPKEFLNLTAERKPQKKSLSWSGLKKQLSTIRGVAESTVQVSSNAPLAMAGSKIKKFPQKSLSQFSHLLNKVPQSFSLQRTSIHDRWFQSHPTTAPVLTQNTIPQKPADIKLDNSRELFTEVDALLKEVALENYELSQEYEAQFKKFNCAPTQKDIPKLLELRDVLKKHLAQLPKVGLAPGS